MAVIEAYVTNLGKYNEGELASALLKFPTTREAVQEVLKQIGIDNIRYEEIFIADYDGDLSELNACLGEYESIDELNHLACLLSELDKSDLEKFEAVVASGEHTSGAGDLINLAENLDCYDFYIGVSDDETLGRIYRIPISQGWYPNGLSAKAKALVSQSPIYPVHATSKPNIRLQ